MKKYVKSSSEISDYIMLYSDVLPRQIDPLEEVLEDLESLPDLRPLIHDPDNQDDPDKDEMIELWSNVYSYKTQIKNLLTCMKRDLKME